MSQPNTQLATVQSAWRDHFLGNTLTVFRAVLATANASFDPDEHYSKFMPILQSSGMGKSRLIDQYAALTVGVVFTLRKGEQTGYPPGDVEITRFLLSQQTERDVHASFAALLAGSVDAVKRALEDFRAIHSTNSFAAWFREQMAPRDPPADTSMEYTAEGLATLRSEYRKRFCNDVVHFAQKAFVQIDDAEWRLFDFKNPEDPDYDSMKWHPAIQNILIEPLRQLVVDLIAMAPNPETAALFFAFDELANLLADGRDQRRVLALRRVVRVLRELPVWTFGLSTQAPISLLAPSLKEDPSRRVVRGDLAPVEPFYSFPLDVKARLLLMDDKASCLALPFDRFGEIAHLVTFGRPLWLGYANADRNMVLNFAINKLLCTNTYDPQNKDHILAVLAHRVGLQLCRTSFESLAAGRTAVESHLRVIIKLDCKTGLFETTCQSEPIVSAAVAEELMETETNWPRTIKRLTQIYPGLIDRGQNGELVCRLLCVLARDNLLASRKLAVSLRNRPHYAQSFTVLEFLGSLLSECDAISGETNWEGEHAMTVAKAFSSGSMNFSHWVNTDRLLDRESYAQLLHGLLRQQAALQLHSQQKTWDLLIPVYLGDDKAEFNQAKVTCMLIQVKNSDRSNTLTINLEEYKRYIDLANPVLSIMVDLGVKKLRRVKRVASPVPNVIGFIISGFGADIYKCVPVGSNPNTMERDLAALLQHQDLQLSGSAIQDLISNYNHRFNEHDFDGRFPAMLAVEQAASPPTSSPEKPKPKATRTARPRKEKPTDTKEVPHTPSKKNKRTAAVTGIVLSAPQKRKKRKTAGKSKVPT
ncbi:hypothetical protein FN846DRAFT_1010507 [Sphaerosporella brunnea]|uniref:Uncharacterized protein n=1 Tax=Sphaerosporella brunnea TaxID=1250544 RepID=A0A5J5F094_9PEZI|nr:hypothetical protein FN846DRAFT_1010507 [Sphaerosporella brunnea]